MISSKLLLPLRVPELGPHLGKLIIGSGRRAGGPSLDAVRFRLATRVMESAGEARRLAARDERDAALAAVGRAAWLAAWEEAVGVVAEVIVAHVSEHLAKEADAVRMPRRIRRRFAIDPAERRAMRARLGSAGAALVPALDALESRAGAARAATARDRAMVEAWKDTLLTAARRLEAAWLALEDGVRQELARWDGVAGSIAAWRRPWWPVLAVGVVLAAAAVWLGLVLGGYVAPPGWPAP
jgi:hypothetical protein